MGGRCEASHFIGMYILLRCDLDAGHEGEHRFGMFFWSDHQCVGVISGHCPQMFYRGDGPEKDWRTWDRVREMMEAQNQMLRARASKVFA